ncbi:NADH-FMN oxidoreductase RutF, flavin reductase (DIM6/NTAB) family [Paenibacillus sp. CF095]|uniref:flavin reductase family protein n=1 Tax=Paenibacillus sp. CF095 TaxID=1881033 RepID=UPI000888A8DE|nr:flavin reductase family protein [Paenibacillus sp. CF095]SDC72700.1 NADH-FMN oxidoreductase RutF, flavin reductase (DIM6/NTAB) family [Paenibacillus sp. CF095]
MYTLDPREITGRDNYKLMSGSVVPRPIAFVTTLSDENGVINAAPFSFFNVVSSDPPLLSISIARKDGTMKDTARNVLAHQELVVHICDEAIITEVNETAAILEPHESELERTKLTTVPSTKVAVPGIQEALIRMECELYQHIPITNDEGKPTSDLLLVRIVQYHFSEQVYNPDKGYILMDHLKPVSRLAGNDYAKLGERFTVIRPE